MHSQKSEKVRLAARLRAARERAHISVDDAAEAIQVHALAITKWETAKVMPTPIQLRQLMLVYGCSAENLLFDENPWMLSPEQSAELTHVTRSASPSLRAKLDVYIAVHTIGVEPVWKSG